MQHLIMTSVLSVRSKLQKHLLTSDKYAVSLILNKIQPTSLKKELAILVGLANLTRNVRLNSNCWGSYFTVIISTQYGKLREHEKALSVLVHDVRDLEGAEEYCREWPTGRRELHLLLLKIYLVGGRPLNLFYPLFPSKVVVVSGGVSLTQQPCGGLDESTS